MKERERERGSTVSAIKKNASLVEIERLCHFGSPSSRANAVNVPPAGYFIQRTLAKEPAQPHCFLRKPAKLNLPEAAAAGNRKIFKLSSLDRKPYHQ